MNLDVSLIRTDGGTQPRAQIDLFTVDEYADAMRNGDEFPAATVFYDGDDYWLADGFHRIQGAKRAGLGEFPCDIRQGTRRDAVLFSVGANAKHGLRRTNADKRRAVLTLLEDDEWNAWSDREIARRANVSNGFVSNLRRDTVNDTQYEKRQFVHPKTGKPTTMNTANIGGTQSKINEAVRETIRDTHVKDDPSEQRELAKLNPDDQREVARRVRENGLSVKDARRELRREESQKRISELQDEAFSVPDGKYRCIVIDPPWQMQKIERDERPNQAGFDYPTMSEEEIMRFPLPDIAHDDCHLYLWATHKHLPSALRIASHWGFHYQCLMTWVKNVGFTPFSWMYSTEHVLFCRRGNLKLNVLGKRLDFEAKVREHSRKPDKFYELVRTVSPGPRIDIFSREERDGFDQFGNEVDKFKAA